MKTVAAMVLFTVAFAKNTELADTDLMQMGQVLLQSSAFSQDYLDLYAPELKTLENMEETILSMARTRMSQNPSTADTAGNLTGFITVIQDMIVKKMIPNIQTQHDGFQQPIYDANASFSQKCEPLRTAIDAELEPLSANHVDCRVQEDNVTSLYTNCNSLAQASSDACAIQCSACYSMRSWGFVNTQIGSVCQMSPPFTAPTIGNYLNTARDKWIALLARYNETCDKCISCPNPLSCNTLYCSMVQTEARCDGLQKTLEDRACQYNVSCGAYLKCWQEKADILTLANNNAKNASAGLNAQWTAVGRINCYLEALKLSDNVQMKADMDKCKTLAIDSAAMRFVYLDVPSPQQCVADARVTPGTASFLSYWYGTRLFKSGTRTPLAASAMACASECCGFSGPISARYIANATDYCDITQ